MHIGVLHSLTDSAGLTLDDIQTESAMYNNAVHLVYLALPKYPIIAL